MTANAAPFVAGTRVYVWGFTDELEKAEWILASDATWNWPTPDPFNPFDLEWNIGAATEVLAGAVNASGSPFLLRAEKIPARVPPTTTWPQWQMEELAGESANGPDDDPDRDGLSNLEEYAAGTPPLNLSPWASVRPGIVTVGEERYLAITVPLRADRNVSLEIEVSDDLVHWEYSPAAVVLVSEASNSVTCRSVVSLEAVPRQYLRTRFGFAE